MQAKVVGIESASKFVDKVRRITFQVEEADQMFSQFRVAENLLPGYVVNLDDIFHFSLDKEVAAGV